MSPESRTAQASQIVPTGQWQFDPHRTTIGFRVKKMGLYHVKGRFRRFAGTVTARPGELRAEITIAAASVHTRIPPRDAHLRSGQFLHVKQHPEIRVMSDAPAKSCGSICRGRSTGTTSACDPRSRSR